MRLFVFLAVCLLPLEAVGAECLNFRDLNLGSYGKDFNECFAVLQGSFYGGRSCNLEDIGFCSAPSEEIFDVACPESRNCRVNATYYPGGKRVLMAGKFMSSLSKDPYRVSILGHEIVHACLDQTDQGTTSGVDEETLYRWEEFLAYYAQSFFGHCLKIDPKKEIHFARIFMESFLRSSSGKKNTNHFAGLVWIINLPGPN